jgi:uncharacterized membrane protein YhaH (DUF805 family)
MRRFVALTPTGRLGRRGFVLGFVGWLVLAKALLWVAPGFTYTVGGWLLIYLWVCLCSRRLHDMGWSAWVQLAPIIATVGLAVVSFVLGLIYLAIVGVTDGLGGLPGLAIILLLTSAVWIAFIAWLAITPAKVENNPVGETAPLPDG